MSTKICRGNDVLCLVITIPSTTHTIALCFKLRGVGTKSYIRLHQKWGSCAGAEVFCDFLGIAFKVSEVLQFSMSASTTQLLSSGEFCKLRYDTIPVNSKRFFLYQ